MSRFTNNWCFRVCMSESEICLSGLTLFLNQTDLVTKWCKIKSHFLGNVHPWVPGACILTVRLTSLLSPSDNNNNNNMPLFCCFGIKKHNKHNRVTKLIQLAQHTNVRELDTADMPMNKIYMRLLVYPISRKYSTAEKFAFFASCWNSEYFFS